MISELRFRGFSEGSVAEEKRRVIVDKMYGRVPNTVPVEVGSVLNGLARRRSLERCGETDFMTVGLCENTGDGQEHPVHTWKHWCDNWNCPVCFSHAAFLAANRISEGFWPVLDRINGELRWGSNRFGARRGEHMTDWARNMGLDGLMGGGLSPSHWTISFSARLEKNKDLGVKRVRRRVNRLLRSWGVGVGGVVIVHLYRLDSVAKKGFDRAKKNGFEGGVWDWARSMGRDFVLEHRVYGPHAHFIGTGWFDTGGLQKYNRGVVMKKINSFGVNRLGQERFFRAVKYALGHACMSFTEGRQGKAYSWVGLFSARYTREVVETEEEPLRCSCCGGRVFAYSGHVLDLAADGETVLGVDLEEFLVRRDTMPDRKELKVVERRFDRFYRDGFMVFPGRSIGIKEPGGCEFCVRILRDVMPGFIDGFRFSRLERGSVVCLSLELSEVLVSRGWARVVKG